MADNIFDKLDEQSQILARIDKNTASESSAVERILIRVHLQTVSVLRIFMFPILLLISESGLLHTA